MHNAGVWVKWFCLQCQGVSGIIDFDTGATSSLHYEYGMIDSDHKVKHTAYTKNIQLDPKQWLCFHTSDLIIVYFRNAYILQVTFFERLISICLKKNDIGIFCLFWANDSLRHSRTWSTRVQEMACSLFDEKPLPNPLLHFVNLMLGTKCSANELKINIFFEYPWKCKLWMVVILFGHECANRICYINSSIG